MDRVEMYVLSAYSVNMNDVGRLERLLRRTWLIG